MSIKINGWPGGHPHQARIDEYQFGNFHPKAASPLFYTKRDGYVSSFNNLYNRYRKKATAKKRDFTLSKEDFYLLTSQPCYYCAAAPSKKADGKVKNSYIYNGLDRLDSTKGYTHSNCIGCCWEHNRMKGTLSFQEFYFRSLAVTLSISSRTAMDIGDMECLELLIKLFPNVEFLKAHRRFLQEDIQRGVPRVGLRFNWLLQPVRARDSSSHTSSSASSQP
jgi:hypothetical protein